MSNAHLPESDDYPMFVFNILAHLPRIPQSQYQQQIHYLGAINGMCLRMNTDQMLQFSSFTMGQRSIWSTLISYILSYKVNPEQAILAARIATVLILNPRIANDFAATFASSIEVFTEILVPKKGNTLIHQINQTINMSDVETTARGKNQADSKETSSNDTSSRILENDKSNSSIRQLRSLPIGATIIPDVILENFQTEGDAATPESIKKYKTSSIILSANSSINDANSLLMRKRNKLAKIQSKLLKYSSNTNTLLTDSVSSFLSLLSRQSPGVRKILQTETCMLNLIKAIEYSNFLEMFTPSRLINIINIFLNVISAAHDVTTFRLDLLGRKYDLQRKLIQLGSNVVFCGNINWQKVYLEGVELNMNNTGLYNETGKLIYSNQDIYMLKLMVNLLLGYLMDLSIS